MLKIYGRKLSRAIRCMWVMEELGLAYEQVPLNPHAGETRTPEYLAINPAGKIPTLVHDGVVLTESMAINWYLATAFPGALVPPGPQAAGAIWQWTSWAITEVEPTVVAIMREGRRPAEQQDASRVDAWKADVKRAIETVLEPALAGREYLLPGHGFTLADLNAASVISTLPVFGMSLEAHPAVAAWTGRCFAREAWSRAQQRAA